LNAAVLADRRLLDRIHLALEPGEFGGGLLVAADKEQRRPEDDDTDRRRDRVICPLLVLRTRGDCRHRQEPIGAGPQNPDRGRGRTARILCFELGSALGPKGTPRNVIANFNVAVVDALADPALATETAEDPVKSFNVQNFSGLSGPMMDQVVPVV